MLILSVDTSMPILSVALYDDRVIGAIAMEGKESRNQKLLPAIDWLLTESGIDRRDLKVLAVTRGPGSFTGVRVGLATVQGLAFALNVPVVGMSTHEAAAEDWADQSVVLHSDAGRGEFYVSAFRADEQVLEPVLMTAAALADLKSQFSNAVDLGSLSEKSNIALLAANRASRLATMNVAARYADLTPIYVRLAEADVKLQRT
jgi:tRNA threonylcarbamoyladenosine biosynthesis protein TsaB